MEYICGIGLETKIQLAKDKIVEKIMYLMMEWNISLESAWRQKLERTAPRINRLCLAKDKQAG